MQVFGSNSLIRQVVRLLLPNQTETESQLVDAASMDYTPITPNNWGLPIPTTIGQALDGLAQIAAFNQLSGVIAPAQDIVFTTSAITPVKSGTFLVVAFSSYTVSGVTNVTATIQQDGLDTSRTSMVGVNVNPGAITVAGILSASRTTTHTWGLHLNVPVAATVSVGAGGIQILGVELGG